VKEGRSEPLVLGSIFNLEDSFNDYPQNIDGSTSGSNTVDSTVFVATQLHKTLNQLKISQFSLLEV
jgi:hypothetical protein